MTPFETFDGWSIATRQLTGPRKTGGLTSIGGFAFQEAYACLCLARLLDPRRKVVAVRYEGAQDVDLFYSDGRERYLQLKNELGARYTLKKLRPVLQGFAADLLESDGTPGFELIARSNDVDAAVERLRGGSWSEKDLSDIAALLSESVEGSPAPASLRALGERERRDLAERLLRRTTFSFGMGDEVEGLLSFQSRACVELADHGVAGRDLQDAFQTLRAALRPQRTFTHEEVRDILKHFIGGAAIGLFGGRVEGLTDELLAKLAGPEEVMRFYRGEALLDWPIIAAGGDIRRDQQESLVAQLSAPPQGLRLVCLVGEPGAGKSTLARRVAAELHRKHGALVLRVRDKEDTDLWYRVPEFSQKLTRPFYILADDLLRFPEVVAVLGELDAELPLTILATSRTNEYQTPRIKGEVVTVPLEAPSPDEKQRILERLDKSRDELTPEQQRRLDAANQFLVLMIETTAGKELSKIVEDTLRRLRTYDAPAYRAYEYVSFSYQYSISIPESLLLRLDDRGEFHRLTERTSTQGLVFHNEVLTKHVRASHPVFAATAANYYALLRDPAVVLREFVSKADPSNTWEHGFVAHLLRAMAQAKAPTLGEVLPHVEESLTEMRRHATISDLTAWRAMYKALGMSERAEACADQVLTLKPARPHDCNVLQGLFRERRREREALPLIAEWIKAHPDLYGGQEAYFRLLERYGTTEEKKAAIEEFGDWLASHPDDATVRVLYRGLIETHGSPEQIARFIRETGEWLALHPDDAYVRRTYLGLVERNGSAEQLGDVLHTTGEWLALHPDDAYVRLAYLRLMEGRWSAEQVKHALREIDQWLTGHPDNSYIRTYYLKLVEQYGNRKLLEQVIKGTGEWLASHPDDVSVREKYLNLVALRGNAEEAERAIEEAGEWLAHHPDDAQARPSYLGLVERRGGAELVEEVIDKTKAWLGSHQEEKNIWGALLALLLRSGRLEEAAALAPQAISHHPDLPDFTYQYARSLRGSQDEAAVRQAFERLMSDYPDNEKIQLSFAAWLVSHDHLDEARAVYGRMLESRPDDYGVRYEYGRLLLKGERFAEAIEEFQRVIKAWQEHQMAHDGLAYALSKMGEMAEREGGREYAARFFAHAEQEFRKAIRYARLDEQPQAMFHANLGWFYIARGRYAEAVAAFSVAIEGAPNVFVNHWGLGRAQLCLGQLREAEESLLKALELSPEVLKPPASDEIPELLRQCREFLSKDAGVPKG